MSSPGFPSSAPKSFACLCAGSDGQEAFAAPADLNSFDSGNYSFFNQGASLADTAQELHGLSLESEIEDRAGIGNLLDDIGPGDKPAQSSKD